MAETWTVLKVLKWTANHLAEKGIDSPRLDAEWLLADLLGLDRVGLYLQYDRPLQAEELSGYRARVKRRAAREPLAYILGSTEFWSLPLRVSSAVLVPRPETELLVEEALKRLSDSGGSLLDVGTGSGCIALALAAERKSLRVSGLDSSAEALDIARANAGLNGLQERCSWLQGDLQQLPGQSWGMIVSNPPYIPSGELTVLMPEVRDFEPHLALDGGPDGLAPYRALAAQSHLLAPAGWLLVEVGIHQAEEVAELWRRAGLTDIFIRNDYADIPRVVGGKQPAGL